MPTQNFKLCPFSRSNRLSEINISGALTSHSDLLTIHYDLSGPLNLIKIPAPANNPIRKNRLWEKTCFELFLRTKGSDPYWELNFSPSGNWNIYRFDDYRKGMAEETAFSTLPFCVTHTPESFKMILEINVNKLLPSDQPLQAGISAVIQKKNGDMTYWAQAHPAPKPDFHHPDSFILEF